MPSSQARDTLQIEQRTSCLFSSQKGLLKESLLKIQVKKQNKKTVFPLQQHAQLSHYLAS